MNVELRHIESLRRKCTKKEEKCPKYNEAQTLTSKEKPQLKTAETNKRLRKNMIVWDPNILFAE